MNKIEVFNETKKEIKDIEELIAILEFASKKERLSNVEFNVILVDNEYIQNINKNYRNIDRPTDVISFALEDDKTSVIEGENRLLGDIYISTEMTEIQSIKYKHTFFRELSFLAVHGFYHLLGYDHMNKVDEEIMFRKQKEVLVEYEENKV